jgi:mRNA-degrading endonuclease RelE of RelBE toxin-antitoxin system
MTADEWTWELSGRAADALADLDRDTQQRVLDKFGAVVGDDFRDPPAFTDGLTGVGPWRSLRVGEYRAVVRFDRGTRTMQVGAVGHRSSIYDEFP